MRFGAASCARFALSGVLAVVLVAAVGCGPNSSTPDAANNTKHDAPMRGSGSGSDGSGSSAFSCRNTVSGVGDGHHNAGLDCMNACHDHGFTVAGTVYTSSAGTSAASGATVTVIDANHNSMDLPVQTNGNFYTTSSVTFPVTVYASECPSVQMMTASQASNDFGVAVGCNNTSCHASGSTQGVIHLP